MTLPQRGSGFMIVGERLLGFAELVAEAWSKSRTSDAMVVSPAIGRSTEVADVEAMARQRRHIALRRSIESHGAMLPLGGGFLGVQ